MNRSGTRASSGGVPRPPGRIIKKGAIDGCSAAFLNAESMRASRRTASVVPDIQLAAEPRKPEINGLLLNEW